MLGRNRQPAGGDIRSEGAVGGRRKPILGYSTAARPLSPSLTRLCSESHSYPARSDPRKAFPGVQLPACHRLVKTQPTLARQFLYSWCPRHHPPQPGGKTHETANRTSSGHGFGDDDDSPVAPGTQEIRPWGPARGPGPGYGGREVVTKSCVNQHGINLLRGHRQPAGGRAGR